MQERFNAQTGNSYEQKSQDVVIPAFIATYTGQSAKTTSLSPFPALPLPNWRLDYSGLSKIEFFKNLFGHKMSTIGQLIMEYMATWLINKLGLDPKSWAGSMITVAVGNLPFSQMSTLLTCEIGRAHV